MKINDILPTKIVEGGQAAAVRYNSEVGLLHAFAGQGEFDINDIAGSFDLNKLENPNAIVAEIEKFLLPWYNEKIFAGWRALGQKYAAVISEKSGLPSKFGWTGGSNVGAVADIEFIGSEVQGISVKDKGGITLKNLTPAVLGIEPERGLDVFRFHAEKEYIEMKQQIFNEVMTIAKSNPDTKIAPRVGKYSITYLSDSNKFRCEGKKTIEATYEEIMGSIDRNASWQRVFGDWFIQNWASKKSYASDLFRSITKTFEVEIEKALQDKNKIIRILAFEETPYYYATPKSLFYVPSISEFKDVQLKGLRYGAADGVTQKFLAYFGLPDSDDYAEIEIHIRYANGMFEANPTVRIQSLKNPQFLGWESLV